MTVPCLFFGGLLNFGELSFIPMRSFCHFAVTARVVLGLCRHAKFTHESQAVRYPDP